MAYSKSPRGERSGRHLVLVPWHEVSSDDVNEYFDWYIRRIITETDRLANLMRIKSGVNDSSAKAIGNSLTQMSIGPITLFKAMKPQKASERA